MDETILTDTYDVLHLLQHFKEHLRITSDDQDADLRAKLLSALTSVGHDVHRVLLASTVTATGVMTSGGTMQLTLRGPVREVVSVSVNGSALTEGEGYTLLGNKLKINAEFENALVEVVYKAGYHQMPSDIWEAVCLRGAGAYANPIDSVQERLRASDILIRPYRFVNWQS